MLASVPVDFIYYAVFSSPALVAIFVTQGSFEETFTSLAAKGSVVSSCNYKDDGKTGIYKRSEMDKQLCFGLKS